MWLIRFTVQVIVAYLRHLAELYYYKFSYVVLLLLLLLVLVYLFFFRK